MSRRDTKWFAPPSGGYSAHCKEHDRAHCAKCPPIEHGDPPKNPANVSPPNQRIVLVCGRGWGKRVALEEWEALWREMFDGEKEN